MVGLAQNCIEAMEKGMYLKDFQKWDPPTFDESSDDSVEVKLWLITIEEISKYKLSRGAPGAMWHLRLESRRVFLVANRQLGYECLGRTCHVNPV